MPKSRKKRAKLQDFAKVKLKVGKKLPRAENETDASFKTRGIQIREQFKSDSLDGEGATIKKHKLPDLLTQSRHYTAGIRQTALIALRELIIQSPNAVKQNLASIIERSAELFIDRESIVREAVRKVLSVLLPKVQIETIKPFFPMISAHLSCAMTHMNEDIQMYSLKFLDVLLDNYPELVVDDSSKLLANFLELISRSSVGSGDSILNRRTLLINPSGKMGTNKWRIDVIRRLYKVFKVILSPKEKCILRNQKKHFEEITQLEKQSYSGLYQYQAWGLPGLICGDCTPDLESSSNQSSLFLSYIKTLIPLMMQCWVEVGPSSNKKGSGFEPEAMLILMGVLESLSLLLEYITQLPADGQLTVSWVRNAHLKDMVRYFMSHFPYNLPEVQANKKQKQSGESQKLSTKSLNLAVCNLMSYLIDESMTQQKWVMSIVQFLCNLTLDELSRDELNISLKVFKMLLTLLPITDVQEKILTAVLNMQKSKHPMSSEFSSLLDFFSKLFLENTDSSLRRLEGYVTWVRMFPKFLNQASSDTRDSMTTILHIMKRALCQREAHFVKLLTDQFKAFTDPGFMAKLTDYQRTCLIENICLLPNLSTEQLTSLAQPLMKDIFSEQGLYYCLRIIVSRSTHLQSDASAVDYLGFLLRVLFGELDTCVDSISEDLMVIPPDVTVDWIYHQRQTNVILEQCSLLNMDRTTIGILWAFYITELLKKHSSITVQCTYTILNGSTLLLSDSKSHSPDLLNSLSNVILATLNLLRNILDPADLNAAQFFTDLDDISHPLLRGCISCLRVTNGLLQKLQNYPIFSRSQDRSQVLKSVEFLTQCELLRIRLS